MSDKEKAEVNESNVRGLEAMQSMGFPKRMILQEARKLGRRTGNWSSITDEDISDAEDNDDAMPSPAELLANVDEPGEEESEGNAPGKSTADSERLYDWNGLPLHIETRRGEVRTGGGQAGTGWSVIMPCDYGFIAGEGSAEGAYEELDIFMGPAPDSKRVWIINQFFPDGSFDEHKVMLGFTAEKYARATYNSAFSDGKGPARNGGMISMSLDQFKAWLKSRDTYAPA